MKKTKKLLIAAFCSAFAFSAMAQDSQLENDAAKLGYYPQPYGFIQAQGGVNSLFSPGKHLEETFGLSAGYMFSPAVGLRLNANAYKFKNGFHSVDAKYRFHYISTNLDVMVNLTNLIKRQYQPLNVYFIAGFGLNYAWNNDEFQAVVNTMSVTEDVSNAWGSGANKPRRDLLAHNVRAGVLVDYNIAKHWSVGAEIDLNNTSDRFDSKYNGKCDWYGTAMATVTYKFGFKNSKSGVKPNRPVAKKKDPIRKVFYFDIRETSVFDKATAKKCKDWLAKNPGKKLVVSAYSDKGTGNPELNAKYSQERLDTAIKCLKELGISEDQIEAHSYGDTVQPFEENDKNRCVIIDGIQ